MIDESIQIQDLSQAFGDLHVLDGISLAVRRGQFVAIVGPSGCGKSTLLKIIGGLLEPTHGLVWLDRMAPAQRRKEVTWASPSKTQSSFPGEP
jgi:ABC-type Fe3+/spermidine/putrescine transport system ATPase subunit